MQGTLDLLDQRRIKGGDEGPDLFFQFDSIGDLDKVFRRRTRKGEKPFPLFLDEILDVGFTEFDCLRTGLSGRVLNSQYNGMQYWDLLSHGPHEAISDKNTMDFIYMTNSEI